MGNELNRRAFILSVFGGVAALEMGTAADLAIPDRMPLPDPVPDPAKWWNPDSYGFLAEMRSSEWCVQSLYIAKNFYVREIAWYVSNGAGSGNFTRTISCSAAPPSDPCRCHECPSWFQSSCPLERRSF